MVEIALSHTISRLSDISTSKQTAVSKDQEAEVTCTGRQALAGPVASQNIPSVTIQGGLQSDRSQTSSNPET